MSTSNSWFTLQKQERRNDAKRALFLQCKVVCLLFPEPQETNEKNGYAILFLLFLVFLETPYLQYESFVKHEKQVFEKQQICDRGMITRFRPKTCCARARAHT